MKVEDCRIEQDIRLADLESRIRTIEDAVISLNLNIEWMSKAARIAITILGLGLGLDAGNMAGVID